VLECNVKDPKTGGELKKEHIGLRKSNVSVRNSVPLDFKTFLESLDPWFDYLEDWRHALAHRIPLYIPPFCVDPANEHTYHAHETRKMLALAQGDMETVSKCEDAQQQLSFFKCYMAGSFGEHVTPIYFHSQILVDFKTVEELAKRILTALHHRG
jgi:hypothetical protein